MNINVPSFTWSATPEELLVVILVGLVAGFLASRVVGGHLGVIGDIVVGILGSLIGAFVLGAFINDHVLTPLGVTAGTIIARIIVAFIGAILLLAILHLFVGRGRGSSDRSWRRG